ncbi:S8 family peptidase [Rubellicoccus peritrichatus]|uniref:S8 family serine peptidase n=1 Tax=Rubellicoccus peritrichatus TaxID=3080537 RepID=A0AAQ3LEF0_9BACT|nr:S8 family serine peptidase [Puniceicoccus sp. CR14]WOO42385.1 S8 family serine peptidase [Puniceicoccus sp. CR14]
MRSFHYLAFIAVVLVGGALVWRGASHSSTDDEPAQDSSQTRPLTAKSQSFDSEMHVAEIVEDIAEPDAFYLPEAPSGSINGDLTLTYRTAAEAKAALRRLKKAGVGIRGYSDQLNTIRVRARSESERSAVSRLAGNGAEAGFNFPVSAPPDPIEGEAGTGTEGFGANAVKWMNTPDNPELGSGVTVAVIDSGISAHDNLDGSVSNAIRINGNNVDYGHGTAVASLIAGQSPEAPGVAPGAELIDIQVLAGDDGTDAFKLAEAIVAATDAGANVINLSLGANGDAGILYEAVKYASANGAILVASAGNDATGALAYPAAYSEVVGVTSIDANAEPTTFSNFGEGATVAAPGVGINAAWTDEELVTFSGTSASAPLVSGALAALLSENPGMTSTEAVDVLTSTANDSGAPGYDPYLGAGTVDVGRMLNYDTPGINDVAVADHYIVRDESNLEAVSVLVTVQNRGTEWANNNTLTVEYEGRTQDYYLGGLNPGQTASQEILLNPSTLLSGQPTRIASEIKSTGTEDSSPENNSRVTVISLPPPEGE